MPSRKRAYTSRRAEACNRRRDLNDKRVVFVDLDDTLFDEAKARKKASTRAISSLGLRIPLKEALQLHKIMVGHWEVCELMGLPNFKLLWNSPKLYEVLIALVAIGEKTQRAFEKKLEKVDERLSHIETLGKSSREILRLKQREIEAFEEKPETRAFREGLRNIENDKSVQTKIKRACEEFELSTRHLTLFNGVRDFLDTMDNSGIDLYVISEGDPLVQMDKVKKLGLDELLNNGRVIVVREKSKNSFLQIIRSIQANSNDSLRLAVVGNRYDKDLAPLIELLGENVITIRLLYGKYKNKYTDDVLEKEGLPKPMATIFRIDQAKKLLLKRSLWEKVKMVRGLG